MSPPPNGLLVLAAVAIIGCNYPTELPIEYETEHLRIGTEPDDAPLCRGDLIALEHQLARIEDELELELAETYTVYIWSEETWWAGAINNCPGETSLGCTMPSRAIMWTTRGALGHELVHAVMGRSSLHPFFEEGLAELYGGQQTRLGLSAPSANEDTHRNTTDVRTATHFLRWLREQWGPHPLARLAHDGQDGFSDFESIYGMTIEEAEQLYFAEAPYAYASLYDCQDLELASAEIVDGWIDTITLDCETGVDTRSAGEGIIVHRTLEVPEPGYYSVSTNGEWFDIYRCGNRFDAPAPDSWLEDVPSSHAGYPDPAYRHYAGGEVHDLYFEAGRHDIGVGILSHEPGVANVAIWSTLAPIPGGAE
jgi:hypothetical protein